VANSDSGQCWASGSSSDNFPVVQQTCDSTASNQWFSLKQTGFVPNCKPGVLPIYQIATTGTSPLCITINSGDPPSLLQLQPCTTDPSNKYQNFAFEGGALALPSVTTTVLPVISPRLNEHCPGKYSIPKELGFASRLASGGSRRYREG
jgi:hypothetical protein